MNDETHDVRELRRHIKQLGKQNGRQGQTIHQLRGELAEMREMTSRVQRNELRELDRIVASLRVTIGWHIDTIAALREKLNSDSTVVAEVHPTKVQTGGNGVIPDRYIGEYAGGSDV